MMPNQLKSMTNQPNSQLHFQISQPLMFLSVLTKMKTQKFAVGEHLVTLTLTSKLTGILVKTLAFLTGNVVPKLLALASFSTKDLVLAQNVLSTTLCWMNTLKRVTQKLSHLTWSTMTQCLVLVNIQNSKRTHLNQLTLTMFLSQLRKCHLQTTTVVKSLTVKNFQFTSQQ